MHLSGYGTGLKLRLIFLHLHRIPDLIIVIAVELLRVGLKEVVHLIILVDKVRLITDFTMLLDMQIEVPVSA